MKEAKGGTFAKADMNIIRKALAEYARSCPDEESKPVANLIHRLGRIS